MARSKSSSRWLKRQHQDPYVARAQAEGYRSRAVYKLQELDDKYGLIQAQQVIVDLGAAPGAWSQYAVRKLGKSAAKVIALDILPIEPIDGVSALQGDFTEAETLTNLVQMLSGRPVDLVICDMAPNISGNKAVDQPKSMYLAELAFDFANKHLNVGGIFVVKLFQGEGFPQYISELRARFKRVSMCKPQASRKESKEMYAVARDYGL